MLIDPAPPHAPTGPSGEWEEAGRANRWGATQAQIRGVEINVMAMFLIQGMCNSVCITESPSAGRSVQATLHRRYVRLGSCHERSSGWIKQRDDDGP